MSKSKKEKKPIYKEIPLDKVIEPDGRLRMDIDQEKIETLARSIESVGMRQAIEVIPRDDKFEIVYGERRVLAHRALGRDTIWAKIVDLTDDEAAMIRATENVARSDLSPMEEAAAFQDLRDRFQMSIDQVCKKVGRTHSNVKKRLDLLKMNRKIQKAVHQGQIKMSVAHELWQCPDEGHTEYLLELSIDHGATRDVVRQWVNDYRKLKRLNPLASDKGAEDHSPMEQKSIYHTCEVCDGAVNINEVTSLLVCKSCHGKIVQAVS